MRSALVLIGLSLGFVACGSSGPGGGTPENDAGGDTTPPGPGPSLGGCTVFPADDDWNRDVSKDPVDPSSDAYIAAMAPTTKVHPDWGWGDGTYGIPWQTVPGTQAKVPVAFDSPSESDPGPYPIPPDALIEGGTGSKGDRHVLVIDTGACVLYEMFASFKNAADPGWKCGSGAVFDLHSNKLRPDTWTSADAAGLPIFPGLVRFDEMKSGEIKHAFRFTMVSTQRAFIHPATHYASSKIDANLPPMGLRLRLKASFDTSALRPGAKVIAAALKKYGMLVADNGSNWYITGETNVHWDDKFDADNSEMDILVADFGKVHGSDFEVVKTGTIVK